MKIESFDHALPYFFTRRVDRKEPGDLLELERSKGVLANILRWEDDGGKITEISDSMFDRNKEKLNG